MKECPYCAEQIQDKAIICKHCDSELLEESEVVASQLKRRGNNKVYLSILGITFLLIFGNYHIVTGVSNPLVPRVYFGFSDIFSSIETCTSGPWIIAQNQHPSLCKSLQDAGYLENNEDREKRLSRDTFDKTTQFAQCTTKCDPTSSTYSACLKLCY